MGTSGGSAKGVTDPISTMVLVSISSDRQNTAAGWAAPVTFRGGGVAMHGQEQNRGACRGQLLPASESAADGE